MNTQTIVNPSTPAVNHDLEQKLANNLRARLYFYQAEGMTSQKFNAVQRAFEAANAEFGEKTACAMWKWANEDVEMQWHRNNHGPIKQPYPFHMLDGTHFRKNFRKEQAEYVGETNSLADLDWDEAEEEVYDGTNFRQDLEPRKFTAAKVEEWCSRLRDDALEGILDVAINKPLHSLARIGWLATLTRPLLDYGQEVDPHYRFVMGKYIREEIDVLPDDFLNAATRMLNAMHHRGMKAPVITHEFNQNHRHQIFLRGVLMREYGRMTSRCSDTIEDETELMLLKDERETQLIDYTPDSITKDLSLQIRHQGWTFNRKATVGVGSPDPIQQLFHMSQDMFYSHLRLREAPIAFDTTSTVLVDHHSIEQGPTKDGSVPYFKVHYTSREAMPVATTRKLASMPKVEIFRLLNPTAYRLNEDRKRVVMPYQSIDSIIRALAMCRWHDEVHGTHYQAAAEKALTDKYKFTPVAIELAEEARMAMPSKQDEINLKIYAKEDAFLRKHRYGHYHSKAVA